MEMLSDMLNTEKPQYADVHGARQYLSGAVRTQLMDYLLGDQLTRKWYYYAEHMSQVYPRTETFLTL
jgi:hypothetical protein